MEDAFNIQHHKFLEKGLISIFFLIFFSLVDISSFYCLFCYCSLLHAMPLCLIV